MIRKLKYTAVATAVTCAFSVSANENIPKKLDPNLLDPVDKYARDLAEVMSKPEVAKMVEIWNQTNDNLDMKCVDCHSTANAIEFAITGIEDDDIFRRGIVHHSSDDIQALIEGSKVLSDELGIARPGEINRDDVFVMQPGPTGKPSPGVHYWERDAHFAKYEMAKHTPIFAGFIPDLATAKKAYDEFQTLTDSNAFTVPWVSPVYSGDTFRASSRGATTGTTHKWVSMVPIQGYGPEEQANIDALRQTYIEYPSNENFDNLYRAIDEGAGPFGIPIKEFGGTSGNSTSDRVANHPLAAGLNDSAAGYEKAKYLAGIAGFHAELQKILGIESILEKPNPMANLANDPTKLYSGGDRERHDIPGRSKRALLKAGDTSSAMLSLPELTYPDFLLDSFLTFFDTNGMSNHEKNILINSHSKKGSADWWGMEMLYNPFFQEAFYWQGATKLHGTVNTLWPNGTPDSEKIRENADPGYPVYNVWANLRASTMRGLLEGKQGEMFLIRGPDIAIHQAGLYNKETIGNDIEYRIANIRTGINYAKIALAARHEKYNETNRIDRRTKMLTGNIFYFKELLQYAQELDELLGNEDNREYNTLKGMFEADTKMVRDAFARAQTGSSPEWISGNGNGLRLEVFDDPNFEVKLSDYIASPYQQMFREGSNMANAWENNLFRKIGSSSKAYNTNYIDGDIQGMSYRWSGKITVPVAGNYDIWEIAGGRQDNAVRLWIDGVKVFDKAEGVRSKSAIDGAGGNQMNEMSAFGRYLFCGGENNIRRCNMDNINHTYMEPGEFYDIKVEISSTKPHHGPVAGTMLLWSAEGVTSEPVPDEYFYSDESALKSSVPQVIDNGMQAGEGFFGRVVPPSKHQDIEPHVWLETSFNQEMRHQFEATSDNGPVRFMLAGNLPDGLSLTEDGLLTGVLEPKRDKFNRKFNELHEFTLVVLDADNEANQVAVRIDNISDLYTDSDNIPPPGGTTPPPGGGTTPPPGNGGDDGTIGYDSTLAAGATRLEAENMTLTGDYQIENKGAASEGGLIRLNTQVHDATGMADAVFEGESGIYTIKLGYFDEQDGQSIVNIALNGESLASLTFAENSGSGVADSRSFRTVTLEEPVTLQYADTLSITGYRDAEEFARIDYLDLIPVSGENVGDDPSEPTDPLPGDNPYEALGAYIVNIGDASGQLSLDGATATVTMTGDSNGLANRNRNDSFTFVPLLENLNGDGVVTVKLDDFSSGHAGLMIRGSFESNATMRSSMLRGSDKLQQYFSRTKVGRVGHIGRGITGEQVRLSVTGHNVKVEVGGFNKQGKFRWFGKNYSMDVLGHNPVLGLAVANPTEGNSLSVTFEQLEISGFGQ